MRGAAGQVRGGLRVCAPTSLHTDDGPLGVEAPLHRDGAQTAAAVPQSDDADAVSPEARSRQSACVDYFHFTFLVISVY